MKEPTQHSYYGDKKYPCMTSTQELIGKHNDSAHKSWSKLIIIVNNLHYHLDLPKLALKWMWG